MTRAPSDAGMDHIPEAGKMVERVARAICAANGLPPDLVCQWRDQGVVPMWRTFGDEARAAIEAMREPTPGMLWAHELPHVGPDDLKEFWQAAIDAALRDGEG